MAHGERGSDVLQGLDVYEQMVNTFEKQAKSYWGLWGPPGEAMGQGVEAWAQMQRTYIQWLRQVYGGGNQP
ncbi:MAG: hypothetical protein JOZ19_01860 [Rubrobacter sp.]|nr:hypothetical protein [Rubrobacter sp.]